MAVTLAANDSSCRPNQLFAISLEHPVLDQKRWSSVVKVAQEKLLTSVGLRSLSPDHPDYKPIYSGDLRSRDGAYHQGTVWAWLIGPFIDAWLKVHPGDKTSARKFLDTFPQHLGDDGIAPDLAADDGIFSAEWTPPKEIEKFAFSSPAGNKAVVSPRFEITTPTLPCGPAGVYYSKVLNAAGGMPSYTWTVSSGNLPNGLTLNSATGDLSGFSYWPGTYNFTMTVTDANGLTDSKNFTLTVNEAPSFTSPDATSCAVGIACLFTVTTGGYPLPAITAANVQASLSSR